MTDSPAQPAAKRKRLSYACNYCREKKTRCDEEQPCRNCRLAGVQCVTTDKRRDNAPVSHRRRPDLSLGSDELRPRSVWPINPADAPRRWCAQFQAGTSPLSRATPRTPESTLSSITPAPQDQLRLWSQCWGKDGWRTGRLPMMPRFVGSSTVELLGEWLNMALYRLKAAKTRIIPPSINGDFASLILEHPPDLPLPPERHRAIDTFWKTLHQLFPFLGQDAAEIISAEASTAQNLLLRKSSDAPSNGMTYLIITAGLLATPSSVETRALVSSYLSYCNSLLGYILATRSLKSVQFILLLSIVLRSCDKLAWAWDVLSMGVSIAQSIGINRSSASSASNIPKQPTSESETWWCMYVFEKILAFELGRPSVIWDRVLSETSSASLDVPIEYKNQFQCAAISLANMLHEMQERSARAWRREEWLPQSVDQAIEEKIQTGGELVTLLDDWKKSLPPGLRSTANPNLASSPQAAFLSFYYNLGFIHINRSTLLISETELQTMVDRYALGKPWHQRLLNGPAIITEASRDMIKLFVSMVDSGTPSLLLTMTSPLAAVYAIAISILRQRTSLLARADFEVLMTHLMRAGIQITTQHYHQHGTANNIDEILLDLERYTLQCLEGSSSAQLEEPNGDLESSLDEHSAAEFAASLGLDQSWGPSALDWAGWDWNDLSHLFQHNE
ncbi:hypothetical protein N7448_005678 [Penicillium atrosanguineum]|uniref:Uncharacterized protein n=1 Tax=Penicillium atrosanguineum TaxID=1132637 RepID=A0A9W9U089_9EURO|nr:hypothetical protein N7448_005678 [Penicillium atrosanguineum]KAJ5302503.1 hypothetical protein N7476_009302 [Penicillium atrosanguineum]